MNRLPHNGNGRSRTVVRVDAEAKTSDTEFILRIGKGELATFSCYSPKPHGITVHWDVQQSRSEGHYEPEEECEGCQKNKPQKNLFYLWGQWCEKQKFCFLELPEGACKHLIGLLGMGETLRGAGLVIRRGDGKKAHLQIRLGNRFDHPEALPKDKDPLPTLESLWGKKRDTAKRRSEEVLPDVSHKLNGSVL